MLVDLGFQSARSGFQAEALAYRPDGTVIKAIAPKNAYLPWDPATGDVDLLLEAAANPDVAGEDTF
ncbi:MAG TPA: hypothetical protein PKB06_08395, partial [Actinotalea sp.]|nr:hypothetical protein [Actinotalea sp.]